MKTRYVLIDATDEAHDAGRQFSPVRFWWNCFTDEITIERLSAYQRV